MLTRWHHVRALKEVAEQFRTLRKRFFTKFTLPDTAKRKPEPPVPQFRNLPVHELVHGVHVAIFSPSSVFFCAFFSRRENETLSTTV